jgi:hypothetical protein
MHLNKKTKQLKMIITNKDKILTKFIYKLNINKIYINLKKNKINTTKNNKILNIIQNENVNLNKKYISKIFLNLKKKIKHISTNKINKILKKRLKQNRYSIENKLLFYKKTNNKLKESKSKLKIMRNEIKNKYEIEDNYEKEDNISKETIMLMKLVDMVFKKKNNKLKLINITKYKNKNKKTRLKKIIVKKINKVTLTNLFEKNNVININETSFNKVKLIKNFLDPFKFYLLSHISKPIEYRIYNNNHIIHFNDYLKNTKWDILFINNQNYRFWKNIINSKYYLNYRNIDLNILKLMFFFNLIIKNHNIINNTKLNNYKNIVKKIYKLFLYGNYSKFTKKEKFNDIKIVSKSYKDINICNIKKLNYKKTLEELDKKIIKKVKKLKLFYKFTKKIKILDNKLSRLYLNIDWIYYKYYETKNFNLKILKGENYKQNFNIFWDIIYKNILSLNLPLTQADIIAEQDNNYLDNQIIQNFYFYDKFKINTKSTLAPSAFSPREVETSENSYRTGGVRNIQKDFLIENYYNNVLDFFLFLRKPINLSNFNAELYVIYFLMLINLKKNFIFSSKDAEKKSDKIEVDYLFKHNIKNIKDRYRLLFINNELNFINLLKLYKKLLGNNESLISYNTIHSPIKFNLNYKLILYLFKIIYKKNLLNKFRKFSIYYMKFILSILINIKNYYSNNKLLINSSEYFYYNNVINISNFFNPYLNLNQGRGENNLYNYYNYILYKPKPYFFVGHRFYVGEKIIINYQDNYSRYKKVLYFILQEFRNLEDRSDLWKLESQKIYKYTLKGNLISYDLNNTFEQFSTLDNFDLISIFIKHFNSVTYTYQFIIYKFFNVNSYSYNIPKDLILNSLINFFFSMNFLISKPIFKIYNNKITFHIFFFVNYISKFYIDMQFKNNYFNHIYNFIFLSNIFDFLYSDKGKFKRFKNIILKNFLKKYNNKFNNNNNMLINNFRFIFIIKMLILFLGKLCNKRVELELTRLYLPYNDSNILVQFIIINSKNYNYSKMVRYLIFRANVYNHLSKKFFHFMVYEFNFNLKKSSYISGINIRKAGRLETQRVIPRITLFTRFLGTFSRGKIVYLDFSRLTTKHKRGIICISIALSHFIFN